MALRISELAERTGVSAEILRYYGRLGLLAESGRTEAGPRYYDEAAVERVRFLKGVQWLELRLEEVGALLDALPGTLLARKGGAHGRHRHRPTART